MADKYTPTIGIETHVQLKTKTKLFSAVDNDASKAAPNTLISHIDAGMPGALPVLNEKAIELACRAGLALNTKPQKFSKFDRKHYFYPDLPKGYQITQYEQPIILGGHVDLPDGKKVRITRVHLEEDAGKNTHPAGADYTLVDLNRAGTPLLEIVSEPDIHSAEDAKVYARELYLIMKYADVSDCDLYLGHMRFDVNISISTDPKKPGTRTEIKNLNSFRSVENAVAYEIRRQTKVLEDGGKVIQETRGWDEARQETTSQRGKEEAHDYRYMPEPDIPPVELSEDYIKDIQKSEALLPNDLRAKLKDIDLPAEVIEDLLDRPEDLIEIMSIISKGAPGPARRATYWLLSQKPDEAERQGRTKNFDERLIQLSEMVEAGKLNSNAAQKIYVELRRTDKSPQILAEELNLQQVSDEGAINEVVKKVIKDNPKVVEDIKAGQEKAIGFLVGQVMAQTRGQANPELAQKIIKKKLGV